MNKFKNITYWMIILVFAVSCTKDIDNLDVLNNVTAPANVSATFDISQDNTGTVKIIPNAEGATGYLVTFGDVAGETPTTYGLGDKISHVYAEGVYTVVVTAVGITGLTASYQQELNVTLKAPENLVVTITPDPTNPKIISVKATADYATIMDIFFGDVVNEEPVHALPGETVTHTYAEAGNYLITVVAKSGSVNTTTYQETIIIPEASGPVNLPVDFESFVTNYAFVDFGNATSTVINNPDPNGINTSSRVGQTIKASGAETWAGSFLTMENPIDFSSNKFFKMKVWSPKASSTVKLKVENLTSAEISYEVDAMTTVTNQWEELTYDFSGINVADEYQKVVVFFDFGNAGDGSTYYFDDIKLSSGSTGSGIAGTWKMKPEAGSFGVGPNQGDMSWWAIDAAGVTARWCFFDDTYVFGSDGSFQNVLGAETWIEGWQGGTDACGTPVAPHDGSAVATYTYDAGAGIVTLDGTGAYLGIPKAYNGGELTTPANAPASITYVIALSGDNTEMTLDINIGSGWWRFILVKEGGAGTVLDGEWKMAPEAGSFGVGPNQGDMSWWAIDAAGVTARWCFFDDTYVFGSDGSFQNVLGAETWIEGWQGGTDACGTPVAPHDGSAVATYTYDAGAGTVTLNGTGAFLGIPKAYNGGELTSPANAPASITYIIALSENNTVMTLDINIGSGWWRFKLVKN